MNLSIRIFVVILLFATFSLAQSSDPQQPPTSPKDAQATPAKPMRVRVSSRVAEAQIVKKIAPRYPEEAKQNHVHGTVILHAVISTAGEIQNLKLVSGDPSLATAAMEAVKQWKYKPYLLNGEPLEVDTTVEINFNLGR